jgi:hypothetical protein
MRGSKQRELLEEPDVLSLDESCLISLLKRLSDRREQGGDGASAMGVLAEFLESSESFSPRLLLTGMRLCDPVANGEKWQRLCDMWVERNGPVREQVSSFMGSGAARVADSLLLALHIGGRLSSADLVLWANIRHTLRDYPGLARVLCDLGATDPRLADMARHRIMYAVTDMSEQETRALLDAYRTCALGLPDVDTADVRDWLSMSYSRVGLYAEEIDVLVELGSGGRSAVEQLVQVARRHFALKRYEHAARAASMAYEHSRDADIMGLCASIAHESLVRLGSSDSAAIWLTRTDLSQGRSAARAVAFYQTGGELGKADSLLASLAPGLVRDTLVLRQLLFSGRTDSAATYATAMAHNGWWKMLTSSALLWRLRVALFGGNMSQYRRLTDSLTFEPSWEHALEVLGYRYRYQRLKSDMAALEIWGKLELALYQGDLQRAAAVLDPHACSQTASHVLSAYLIKGLLSARAFSKAATVAGAVDPSTSTPEHTYYCAEVLIGQGELPKARALLERLILEHPDSIYSSKARILLRSAQS